MMICPNCGVEVEENSNFCSLCGEPILNRTAGNEVFIRSGKARRDERLLTDYQKLTGTQKRKIFWKISGLILISGIIISLLIDFIVNRAFTWSKYPATISLVLFIHFTLNVFLHKRFLLMLVLRFLSVAGIFVLFDRYGGRQTGWDLKLGIPVLIAAYLTILCLVFLVSKAKQKGLNIIAYSLIATGLLSVFTEGMLSIYNRGTIYLEWSLIVMVSVVFISMLLLYIHYRLKKATDLKRFFHI
ncbi:MAG: zinc ribbon domain-containing protein [Mariniphaga sp.]|nr:zinc ribbon domain-containing protein [Mariniphaga sp.]